MVNKFHKLSWPFQCYTILIIEFGFSVSKYTDIILSETVASHSPLLHFPYKTSIAINNVLVRSEAGLQAEGKHFQHLR
jgi:hypothetical protein